MADIIAGAIARIRPPDALAAAAAGARQDQLTKPRGSLGRLEELAVQLAGIQGRAVPRMERKAVITMAADHGVALEGVSAYPQEVTAQMVHNFLGGGAAINVLARQAGADVIVVDMGVASDLVSGAGLVHRKVARGTRNMAKGPAMSREEAIAAVAAGIQVLEAEMARGLDIVGTGDMGIGNTAAASAICAAITGHPVAEVTGRGTGIDDGRLRHKVRVVEAALAVNAPSREDALDVLSKVGGFEIGGLAGVILGAAANRVPVVIDGFISGAAALIAAGLAPQSRDYMVAAHVSVETGHRFLLQHLGLKPLLDLGLRLGEGTGAAVGIGLSEAACRILSDMATFGEAGVSEREAQGT